MWSYGQCCEFTPDTIMDEFEYSSKSNRYSKAQRVKFVNAQRRKRKNSNRLSSIERDYIENVSSAEEEFSCLGENELLESLDKLNFSLSDSESVDEKEYLQKKKKKMIRLN